MIEMIPWLVKTNNNRVMVDPDDALLCAVSSECIAILRDIKCYARQPDKNSISYCKVAVTHFNTLRKHRGGIQPYLRTIVRCTF